MFGSGNSTIKPKKKKCKSCPNMFMPYRSTDKYCSPKCAMVGGSQKAERTRMYHQAKQHREPVARVRAKKAAKERDHYQCMLVGVEGHQCDFRREAHHILYLSEGGPDELWNLITLCGFAHHQIAHADKKWQPVLLTIVNGEGWHARLFKPSLSLAVQKKLNYLADLSSDLPG
jgi:hypothetical protein